MKIAFISHWNDFCLIPLGKCASWRKATNRCKKKSDFEIFESALFMKSGSMTLTIRCPNCENEIIYWLIESRGITRLLKMNGCRGLEFFRGDWLWLNLVTLHRLCTQVISLRAWGGWPSTVECVNYFSLEECQMKMQSRAIEQNLYFPESDPKTIQISHTLLST